MPEELAQVPPRQRDVEEDEVAVDELEDEGLEDQRILVLRLVPPKSVRILDSILNKFDLNSAKLCAESSYLAAVVLPVGQQHRNLAEDIVQHVDQDTIRHARDPPHP